MKKAIIFIISILFSHSVFSEQSSQWMQKTGWKDVSIYG